jgi:hypothetical protein
MLFHNQNKALFCFICFREEFQAGNKLGQGIGHRNSWNFLVNPLSGLTWLTRVLDNRPMKIDEISDGFCTKIRGSWRRRRRQRTNFGAKYAERYRLS